MASRWGMRKISRSLAKSSTSLAVLGGVRWEWTLKMSCSTGLSVRWTQATFSVTWAWWRSTSRVTARSYRGSQGGGFRSAAGAADAAARARAATRQVRMVTPGLETPIVVGRSRRTASAGQSAEAGEAARGGQPERGRHPGESRQGGGGRSARGNPGCRRRRIKRQSGSTGRPARAMTDAMNSHTLAARCRALIAISLTLAHATGCTSVPRPDTVRGQAPATEAPVVPGESKNDGGGSAKPDAKEKTGDGKPAESKNGDEKEKTKEGPKHTRDNAFLVEEAFNQEPGEVQHIFNWIDFWDRTPHGKTRDFSATYTMELPLGSQKHQFSFTTQFLTAFEKP